MVGREIGDVKQETHILLNTKPDFEMRGFRKYRLCNRLTTPLVDFIIITTVG
jgi:hypothetical protein